MYNRSFNRSKDQNSTITESSVVTNPILRDIEHDALLESYLKRGVYQNIGTGSSSFKSPAKGSTDFSRAPHTEKVQTSTPGTYQRRPVSPAPVDRSSIECWAYFDKKQSEYSFIKRGERNVQIGGHSKHRAYDKNEALGEVTADKTTTFKHIVCAEDENKMIELLTASIGRSLNTDGSHYMFLGKSDKLFLLQILLRLMIDEFTKKRIHSFVLTCSKNLGSILETFFGDDDPNLQENTFKIDSSLYELFGQVSDRLDEHMTSDEFLVQIDYSESRFLEAKTIIFSGLQPLEKVRHRVPRGKSTPEHMSFLRQLMGSHNFTGNHAMISEIIDRATSINIKFIATFSHLVSDYMNNDFIIDLANTFGEKMKPSNIVTPSRNAVNRVEEPHQHQNNAERTPGGSYRPMHRRTQTYGASTPHDPSKESIDQDKLTRESSSHVRNIFKYMN